MTLEPGLRAAFRHTVTETDTAVALGSGEVPMLATPRGRPDGDARLNGQPTFRYKTVGPDSSAGGLKPLAAERSTVIGSPGTVLRPSMPNHSAA